MEAVGTPELGNGKTYNLRVGRENVAQVSVSAAAVERS
jgi:hypothetical protein